MVDLAVPRAADHDTAVYVVPESGEKATHVGVDSFTRCTVKAEVSGFDAFLPLPHSSPEEYLSFSF